MLKDLLEKEGAEMFLERRNEARQEAREAIAKIQDENKRSYNKKKKAPNS